MATPMDALASFTHLTDNLPHWLSKLDELSVQVAEQHARFMRITQLTEVRLARKKHDSTESLRPRDDLRDNNGPTAILITDASAPPTSDPMHSKAIIIKDTTKDIRRKRKPGSALSGASGPQRYRTRSMVVVYYDSDIQKAFETLVRNIAGARNNLRKGRTAASFKSRMASMGLMERTVEGVSGFTMFDPKIRMKVGSDRQAPSLRATDSGPPFEEVDQDLEKAQSLCEVAAHQFLRDGDCRQEINGARAKFEKCLGVAKSEAEKLREAEAKEKEQEQRSEETPEVTVVEKVMVPAVGATDFPGTGVIEIDYESDASSVHIDLSAFRRTRRV